MSDRDPRLNPVRGDVLLIDGFEVCVQDVSEDGYVQTGTHRGISWHPLLAFRKWAENATVVWRPDVEGLL